MIVRLAIDAMRTRFEFVLAGEHEHALHAAGEAAIAEVEACESRLSLFLAGSLVSKVNREAHGRAVAIDGDTFDLLQLCHWIYLRSRGAFDITVGALMKSWGFRDAPAAAVPENAARGGEAVLLDHATRSVRFSRPDIALDLGAVGKGHALDLAGAVLREAGVTTALLHAGTSSILALGAPPGEAGWCIALAGEGAPVVILRDAALGVSAQHGRIIQGRAGAIGHVLDPRSGRPVGDVRSAGAITASAAAADAWSTALLVLAEHPDTAPGELTSIINASPAEGWRVRGFMSDRVQFRGEPAASVSGAVQSCPSTVVRS